MRKLKKITEKLLDLSCDQSIWEKINPNGLIISKIRTVERGFYATKCKRLV